MTDAKPGDLDMTMMLAFHAAFRRDADRLLRSADQLDRRRAPVRAGWADLAEQLERHHRAEDEELWPIARQHLTASRSDDLAMLDAMEAEHHKIIPLADSVDRCLSDPEADADDTTEAIAQFRDVLLAHLAHEEADALPLLNRTVTPAEWKSFAGNQRKKAGLNGAAKMFPWLLQGDTPEVTAALRRRAPAPIRLLNQFWWAPVYNRTDRW